MEWLPHTRNLNFCTHSAKLPSFSLSCFAMDQLKWKWKVCWQHSATFAITTHQAKIQICSMVKLIPWNLVSPIHLYTITWNSRLTPKKLPPKICYWKFGSYPRKGKVDLCMTNSSKVMIYLTLLYFLLHYLQDYR